MPIIVGTFCLSVGMGVFSLRTHSVRTTDSPDGADNSPQGRSPERLGGERPALISADQYWSKQSAAGTREQQTPRVTALNVNRVLIYVHRCLLDRFRQRRMCVECPGEIFATRGELDR